MQRIEKEAKEEVDAAVKVAESGPEPTLDDLFLDVYADDNMEGHKIRGCDNWIRQATNWKRELAVTWISRFPSAPCSFTDCMILSYLCDERRTNFAKRSAVYIPNLKSQEILERENVIYKIRFLGNGW